MRWLVFWINLALNLQQYHSILFFSCPHSLLLYDASINQRYDKYGAALEPSPGHLIGVGTVGRLVPLSIAATGAYVSQLLWRVGACSSSFCALGCAASATGSWLKARASEGRANNALPAVLGGLVLGNAAGFVVGIGSRGTVRWLMRRRS